MEPQPQERKQVDLSAFDNSADFDRGASFVKATLWHFTNALIFRNALFPFRSPKPAILRLFGAKVGRGVVIHPGVNIRFPWKLTVGDHCWLGQSAWLENTGPLVIEDHVTVSQGAFVLTGNHDYSSAVFNTFVALTVLERGSWVGAQAKVAPGVRVGSHAVLAMGSVATRDLPPYTICQGIPAVPVRERLIQ